MEPPEFPEEHPDWFEVPDDADILDYLHPGERLEEYARGLIRVALQLFRKCEVGVTDSRVLIMEPKWPRGYGLSRSFYRTACSVVNARVRFDGSTLVLLKSGEEILCLYFGRRVRDKANSIVRLLGTS